MGISGPALNDQATQNTFARSLQKLITPQLLGDKVMPWEEFMRLALYHPDLGYYSTKPRVGARGDFFTSVSVGPLFGQLLADWAAMRLGDLSGPVQVVEAGADQGLLASDALDHWRDRHPKLYARLSYLILEPREASQITQQAKLQTHSGKVVWHQRLEDLGDGTVRGIIWSNELLDAFAVEVWRWNQTAQLWNKQGVRLKNDQLEWASIEGTARAAADLSPFAAGLAEVLQDGFQMERQVEAIQWWKTAAQKLKAGWLMAADYGESESHFWQPERSQGTLRGYREHRVCDPFTAIDGETDLTTTVHFDLISETGSSAGLTTEYYGPQRRFLMDQVAASSLGGNTPLGSGQARALITLTSPDQLGNKFKILVQKKTE